jgi:phage gp29-like protein
MAEYLPATTTPSTPPALVDHLGRPLRAEQMTRRGRRADDVGRSLDRLRPPGPGPDARAARQPVALAEQGDATAYLELAEEMEEKDLHYLSVLGTRKRAISQLPIEVDAASDDPEDEADAQLIRDWLQARHARDRAVRHPRRDRQGLQRTEIVWDFTAKAWLPCRLKWRDPRWFEFDRVDGETLMLKGLGGPRAAAGFKFITHVHPAKSGLPIRGGLARPVAWAYLFKNYAIKDWVTFLDAYGMPLRVGKYENGTTEDNIRLLMRALSMLGSDAAAAFPKSMDVEFVDRKGGETGDLFERLATWADLQVSKAVLGQTSTTDAVAGGLGSGQATTHNDVRGDIERADAKLLSATLNRDLVQPIVMLNRGQREAYPKIRIGRPEEEDVKAFLEGVDAAVKYGVRSAFRRSARRPGSPSRPRARSCSRRRNRHPPKTGQGAAPATGTPVRRPTARMPS